MFFCLEALELALHEPETVTQTKPGRTFRSPRQYLNDWSHSLITFVRYFSELVPIFMGNHSLAEFQALRLRINL